jgi:hypothetical protein
VLQAPKSSEQWREEAMAYNLVAPSRVAPTSYWYSACNALAKGWKFGAVAGSDIIEWMRDAGHR